MTQEDEAVSLELFKDVKFYVVGDIDPKVSVWKLAFSELCSLQTSYDYILSMCAGEANDLASLKEKQRAGMDV